MSKINKIIIVILLFLPALSLLFTPFSFFPWHFGKTVIFEMVLEIVLLAYLLVGRKEQLRPKLNYLDWSLIFFLLILLVTAFFGENLANSFWGNQSRANGVIVWLHFGIFYFLLGRFFQKQKDWLNLLTVGFFAALLAGLSSVFQRFLPELWQSASGGGLIGNRAFLATYLLLAIGIGFYLFKFYKNKIRWAFLVLTLLIVWILLSLGNRGAALGLIFGLLSFLALSILCLREKKRRWLAGGALLAIFIFFALVFLFPKINSVLPQGLSRLANVDVIMSAGTGETRLMAWQIAWQGIKQHPVLGIGLGNYEIFFNRFYNPQFLKYNFQETVWDKPHSWPLEMWTSAGIIGLLSYLSIIISAVYLLFRKFKLSPAEERSGFIILISVLCAYLTQSLFLFETTNSLILWFIILGYISFLHGIGRAAVVQGTKKINGYILYLAKIILSALLIFLFLFNVSFLRASYYMRQADLSDNFRSWVGYAESALSARTPFLGENAIFLAEKFTQFDRAEAFANSKNLEKIGLDIARVLQSYSARFPNNLSYPVWAGQVYLVLGSRVNEKYYQEADKALRLANNISPRKQEVLFLLGRLYLLQQKFSEALQTLQSAVALAPNINTSHWFLGLTYVAEGDIKSGLKEIEKAEEMGYNIAGEQRLYVLDLYAQIKDYDKLTVEYKKLIEDDPENLDWYVKLATVYAVSGQKKEALAVAKQILELSPDSVAQVKNFIKEYKLE